MSDEMPVQKGGEDVGAPSVRIPMQVFRPYERRARRNHNQSLDRLADRGGLSVKEAACILRDEPWQSMGEIDHQEAWMIVMEETVRHLSDRG